jgi:hypothetical protein
VVAIPRSDPVVDTRVRNEHVPDDLKADGPELINGMAHHSWRGHVYHDHDEVMMPGRIHGFHEITMCCPSGPVVVTVADIQLYRYAGQRRSYSVPTCGDTRLAPQSHYLWTPLTAIKTNASSDAVADEVPDPIPMRRLIPVGKRQTDRQAVRPTDRYTDR